MMNLDKIINHADNSDHRVIKKIIKLDSGVESNKKRSNISKRLLLSQHGLVWVSEWHPRKINEGV